MSKFELVEVQSDFADFRETVEDSFFAVKLKQTIEKTDSKQELREIASKLVELATQRQGIIRGLCMKLVKLETEALFKKYAE
jgi:hypothetical protein